VPILGAPAGLPAAWLRNSQANWVKGGKAPVWGARHCLRWWVKNRGWRGGTQTSAAGRGRACSAARTVARWNLQMAVAEVTHSKGLSIAWRGTRANRAPAGLPSYRRGRRAVIRLLRTPSFHGRRSERCKWWLSVSSGFRRAGRKL